jgi:hypothetical protein
MTAKADFDREVHPELIARARTQADIRSTGLSTKGA